MSFSLLQALGIRVIEVEDFDYGAHYLPDINIVLVDKELDSGERQCVTDALLARLGFYESPV